MSQMGMNLPGGARRRAQMNVYTGLLFVAVICLATACVMMWMAGTKIGPKGQPLELHKVNAAMDPKTPAIDLR